MGVTGIGRERFLSDASRILAASLNLQETLKRVAELVVPYLADWCVVDLLEDGQIRRRAIAQCDGDPQLEAEMMHYAPDPTQPRGVARVLATRRAEMCPEFDDLQVQATARGAEHLAFLHRLGLSSLICVPMIAHDRVLGTLMLFTTRSQRHYDCDDLALAEDLAYRSAMAVENAQLYQRVEEANRGMDRFLATVSHELRTPLAAVSLWCDLLRDKQHDTQMVNRALDAIHAGVRSQSRLLEDLVDLARIQSDTLLIERKDIGLAEVIEGAHLMVRPAAERKQIALSLSLPDSVPAIEVLGDAQRLRQVMVNLLTNAIKFTPEGGAVAVTLRREGRHAVIDVTDTGRGIEREVVPRIFDRFYQGDQERARATSGLGLGLTIVRRLVALHGGSVIAASPGRDRGATFTVRLPLSESGSAHAGEVVSEQQASVPVPCALEGVAVLFVEDEPAISEVVGMALESQGARVTLATSVSEALERIAESVPDVLLSDIAMPGEDGYSLMRKVRAMAPEQGGRTPAAALTAHVRPEDKVRALQAGFQAHIRKPVDLEELTACVAQLAGRELLPQQKRI